MNGWMCTAAGDTYRHRATRHALLAGMTDQCMLTPPSACFLPLMTAQPQNQKPPGGTCQRGGSNPSAWNIERCTTHNTVGTCMWHLEMCGQDHNSTQRTASTGTSCRDLYQVACTHRAHLTESPAVSNARLASTLNKTVVGDGCTL